MFATPILAKIAVSAANIADSSASKTRNRTKSSSYSAFRRGKQSRLMMSDEGIDHFIQRFAVMTLSSLYSVRWIRWSVNRPCGKL